MNKTFVKNGNQKGIKKQNFHCIGLKNQAMEVYLRSLFLITSPGSCNTLRKFMARNNFIPGFSVIGFSSAIHFTVLASGIGLLDFSAAFTQ